MIHIWKWSLPYLHTLSWKGLDSESWGEVLWNLRHTVSHLAASSIIYMAAQAAGGGCCWKHLPGATNKLRPGSYSGTLLVELPSPHLTLRHWGPRPVHCSLNAAYHCFHGALMCSVEERSNRTMIMTGWSRVLGDGQLTRVLRKYHKVRVCVCVWNVRYHTSKTKHRERSQHLGDWNISVLRIHCKTDFTLCIEDIH